MHVTTCGMMMLDEPSLHSLYDNAAAADDDDDGDDDGDDDEG